jgi:hypothetical protein
MITIMYVHFASLRQVTYMKVKAFKLLPGVYHEGPDWHMCHRDVPELFQKVGKPRFWNPSEVDELVKDARTRASRVKAKERGKGKGVKAFDADYFPTLYGNSGFQEFRDKFVISIDGERFDPGFGIICEVHQGLATFIADSKVQRYQPSGLLQQPMQGTSTPAPNPTRLLPQNRDAAITEWALKMDAELAAWDKRSEDGHGHGEEL